MGLFGRQWLSAIEGAPALILVFVALFYLVDKSCDAARLVDTEKDRLVVLCAHGQEKVGSHGARGFAAALLNSRVYLLASIYFTLTYASLSLSIWMPLMIRDFGINDVVSVSLYSVVPNAIGAIGLVLIARRSDRTGERRKHFALCTVGGGFAPLR